jgi:hypothetical protein
VVGDCHTATFTLTGIAVLALTLLVVTVPETAQRPSEPLGHSLDPPSDPRPEPSAVT